MSRGTVGGGPTPVSQPIERHKAPTPHDRTNNLCQHRRGLLRMPFDSLLLFAAHHTVTLAATVGAETGAPATDPQGLELRMARAQSLRVGLLSPNASQRVQPCSIDALRLR